MALFRIWDLENPKKPEVLGRHDGAVSVVRWGPKDRQLYTGSDDGSLKIWSVGEKRLVSTSLANPSGSSLTMLPVGFFTSTQAQSKKNVTVGDLISLVRGLNVTTVQQIHQSLFAPDLVREALKGDPTLEVAHAAENINLDKILDSGPPPKVLIDQQSVPTRTSSDIMTVKGIIRDQGKGVGRVEWRINGVTAAVLQKPEGSGPLYEVTESLVLDEGENVVEILSYDKSNLIASPPARAETTLERSFPNTKPNLYVLAIGINNYVDVGGYAPGQNKKVRFPPLKLAVSDATALGKAFEKAGSGLYRKVIVRTVVDGDATAANIDRVVTQIADKINPRDTFIFFAAAHGYSHEGRFYLIPQDYQGGPDPQALATRAIDQLQLQDWIANRIRSRKALILLDTCESGALTSGHTRSRFDGPASDAAIGRLHEATGRPVLTAAGLGQDALEFTDLGHGVFTSALIDALYHADSDGNGEISVLELAAHVQNLVPKLVKDPTVRAEVARRGIVGGAQSARFGSRGEDFTLVHRLQ